MSLTIQDLAELLMKLRTSKPDVYRHILGLIKALV